MDDADSFNIDGVGNAVGSILANLQLIAGLQRGEILASDLRVMKPGIFTSVYRTLFPTTECRAATVVFFRRAVDVAIRFSSGLRERNNPGDAETSSTIIDAVRDAVAGILRHAQTYSDDRRHQAQINALVLQIRLCLGRIDSQASLDGTSLPSTKPRMAQNDSSGDSSDPDTDPSPDDSASAEVPVPRADDASAAVGHLASTGKKSRRKRR